MTTKKIGVTLVVLFVAVGLAGCADAASDDDQIESDDEAGDDVEADPADNESDDTESDSETESEPDESDEVANGSEEGADDTIEADDSSVPEAEDSDEAELEENESEALEEEYDAIEEEEDSIEADEADSTDEEDGEVEEERDSIGRSVSTVADFEQEVTNEGIDVHTVDFDEDGSLAWSLFEYHSNENVEAGETEELRVIALAYAGLIDTGYQTDELEVAQMDPDAAADYPWAFYRIDTEWAEDYNDGSISEEEYIELIVDTYEVIEYD